MSAAFAALHFRLFSFWYCHFTPYLFYLAALFFRAGSFSLGSRNRGPGSISPVTGIEVNVARPANEIVRAGQSK